MRLNGWRRLWIVVVTPWTALVVLISVSEWPTTRSVSQGEVVRQLDPADARLVEPEVSVCARRMT